VRCGVEYLNNAYHYVDSDPYHVIPLPSVTVHPVVASVFRGQSLTIECRLTTQDAGSYNTSRIFWLKDGLNFTENNGLSPNFTHVLCTRCAV